MRHSSSRVGRCHQTGASAYRLGNKNHPVWIDPVA
ncbi:Uncharacterised protein [Vibrio cholerae]|nr:Uncharacterised protein [Vibrio cholerae]CSI60013.1 Uncharacterised protein [Vibrio cholerae]